MGRSEELNKFVFTEECVEQVCNAYDEGIKKGRQEREKEVLNYLMQKGYISTADALKAQTDFNTGKDEDGKERSH